MRLMLETDPSIKVVGEASNGSEALTKAAELNPDVTVLDINMPDMDGVDVASEIRKRGISSAIMFVTMEKSSMALRQVLDLEVNGYVLKNSGAREMIEAVRTVAGGEKYFSPAVAQLLVTRVQAGRELAQEVDGLSELTPSERKVLQLVASDRTSKEIAADLGVSVRTIEGHRARITRKLGLAGAHSLVKFAFEHKDRL
ncbi:response regulator protein VraR [Haloferula helveola]